MSAFNHDMSRGYNEESELEKIHPQFSYAGHWNIHKTAKLILELIEKE